MIFRSLFTVSLVVMQPGALLAQEDGKDEKQLFRAKIQESIRLLEVTSDGTAKKRKCFTCHGQALPIAVAVEARLRGFVVDELNDKL